MGGLTISYEQFLQFCLASIEMDSITGKLGVLPGKQQKDSFSLGENSWCDKPRILKYMYSCGGQGHGSKDSI